MPNSYRVVDSPVRPNRLLCFLLPIASANGGSIRKSVDQVSIPHPVVPPVDGPQNGKASKRRFGIELLGAPRKWNGLPHGRHSCLSEPRRKSYGACDFRFLEFHRYASRVGKVRGASR